MEFNNTNERTVENFFAAYETISPNNDGNGHGSHCAGFCFSNSSNFSSSLSHQVQLVGGPLE